MIPIGIHDGMIWAEEGTVTIRTVLPCDKNSKEAFTKRDLPAWKYYEGEDMLLSELCLQINIHPVRQNDVRLVISRERSRHHEFMDINDLGIIEAHRRGGFFGPFSLFTVDHTVYERLGAGAFS